MNAISEDGHLKKRDSWAFNIQKEIKHFLLEIGLYEKRKNFTSF